MKYRNGALSPKQARALELLLAGEGVAAVADALKLHRATVSRWIHEDPEFGAHLNRSMRALVEEEVNAVQSIRLRALRVVANAIDDGDTSVAMRFLQASSPIRIEDLGPFDAEEIRHHQAEQRVTGHGRLVPDGPLGGAIHQTKQALAVVDNRWMRCIRTADQLCRRMDETKASKRAVLAQVELVDEALNLVLESFCDSEGEGFRSLTPLDVDGQQRELARATEELEAGWRPFDGEDEDMMWPGEEAVGASLTAYAGAVSALTLAVGDEEIDPRVPGDECPRPPVESAVEARRWAVQSQEAITETTALRDIARRVGVLGGAVGSLVRAAQLAIDMDGAAKAALDGEGVRA
jgi:Homeodomain-like domain